MSDEARLEALMDSLLDSNATPEDVCADCPELLPHLRLRWQHVRRVRAELDVLFPLSSDTAEPSSQRPWEAAALPQLPGYEIEAVLGRGGMGIVYRARHLRLNRPVALKMLLAGPYAQPEEASRFVREAETVAGLRHPNIVQLYDVGDVEGRPYFTMELVEGGSLTRSLAGAPLPAREAAALVAVISGAIDAAHQRGVVHRDLKPANILVTAEGTPKVTDFGLARRLEGGMGQTLSGFPMGTPSYMAPEQARGQTGAIGPAADVYALGAILYELLTGRPPFRGETPAETVLQVISQEPVPPSRLNARVPRDLETICLKCLHKEPARRYPSARDLSEDFRRFLEGKPIRARPVGVVERAVKWVRRRPAAALLIAALLVMAGAAVGTGLWMHQQEANRQAAQEQREKKARTAIETALSRADDLRRAERWQEALHVLTDASPNLAEAHSPTLEERLNEAQSDLRIAEDFERVRGSRPLKPDGFIDDQQRATHWQKAFDRAGLRIGDDPEPVAAYIRASPIRDQLVAAMDDRAQVAFMVNDVPLAKQLLRISQSADPEPRWGDRFRDVEVWRSREQLENLAADAFSTSPPPPGYRLALLGLLLRQAGARSQATQLLGEACRRLPSNFWVNREMGFALFGDPRYAESAAYFRTALALRPEDEGVYDGLGKALFFGFQTDEALAVYRRGLEFSPTSPVLRGRLVFYLAEGGYWREADAECRRALEIAPNDHLPPLVLGNSLTFHGRREDAIVMFQKAIESNPGDADAHYALGLYYRRTARHEEAVKAFRTVKELTPANSIARHMLGVELARTGHSEEAITELQAAIPLDGTPARIYTDLGNLLRTQGRPEEAAAAFRQAATGEPEQGWSALAAMRLDQGRFADARAATEQMLRPASDHPFQRELRRQLQLCDLLLAVEAKLPAILAGKEWPADVPTQLALAEWCLKHKRLTSTAADYYASALAAQPSLAGDREAGHRFSAACAAALAGCGVGADASLLNDRRRAERRQQALDWLTAEYDVWAERHRVGKSRERTVVAQAVRSWQGKDDLAGLRDEQALAGLLPGERRDWETLWSKVATLTARDPDELVNRAKEHVGRREWGQAVACYAETLELAPTDDGELWFEYAAAQLLAGDRPGYCRACAHMLACCQASNVRPYFAARACTLAEGSADDPELPGRLSQGELQGSKNEFWSLTEQAALHVRAGRIQDATPLLEASLRIDGRPARAVLNWLWLALAYQKLGKVAEARRWLDKAANWLDQQGGQMPPEYTRTRTGAHRHNWLEAHVLRCEAEATIPSEPQSAAANDQSGISKSR